MRKPYFKRLIHISSEDYNLSWYRLKYPFGNGITVEKIENAFRLVKWRATGKCLQRKSIYLCFLAIKKWRIRANINGANEQNQRENRK